MSMRVQATVVRHNSAQEQTDPRRNHRLEGDRRRGEGSAAQRQGRWTDR
jgi:hypothetical protein